SDLRTGSTELLGFRLTKREDHLSLSLTEEAWSRLEQELARAIEEAPDFRRHAKTVLTGWASYCGPTLETWRERPELQHRLTCLLTQYGLRETDPQSTVMEPLRRSWDRWQGTRRVARERCL